MKHGKIEINMKESMIMKEIKKKIAAAAAVTAISLTTG